ncbi:MAG: hypothetical protein ACKVS6_04850 [Planctomycetota bacterium]
MIASSMQIYKSLVILLCCFLNACSKQVSVVSISGVWRATEESLTACTMNTTVKCEIKFNADYSFIANAPVSLVSNVLGDRWSFDISKIVPASGQWSIIKNSSGGAMEIAVDFDEIDNKPDYYANSIYLDSPNKMYFFVDGRMKRKFWFMRVTEK